MQLCRYLILLSCVLLSSLTLTRLHDSELKVPADQDAFTTAELLERLTKTIFAETDKLEGEFTNRKPAISSLRRNLQRSYLKKALVGKAKLDSYTQAHLAESASRIRKVVDARLQLIAP